MKKKENPPLPFINGQFLMAISTVEQLEVWLRQQFLPSKSNPELTVPPIGVVVAGRSNVGKSSLINAFFNQKLARSSKTPGRTREVLIFQFELPHAKTQGNATTPSLPEKQKYFLIDLPGYGHAEVSREESDKWQVLLSHFFSTIPETFLILCIQDARHPMQDTDRQFMHFLKPRFKAAGSGDGLEGHMIFNKIDKLKLQSERARLKNFLPDILKEAKIFKQVYLVSAESKQGLGELQNGVSNFLQKRLLPFLNTKE